MLHRLPNKLVFSRIHNTEGSLGDMHMRTPQSNGGLLYYTSMLFPSSLDYSTPHKPAIRTHNTIKKKKHTHTHTRNTRDRSITLASHAACKDEF